MPTAGILGGIRRMGRIYTRPECRPGCVSPLPDAAPRRSAETAGGAATGFRNQSKQEKIMKTMKTMTLAVAASDGADASE